VLADEPVNLLNAGDQYQSSKTYELMEEWEDSQMYVMVFLQDPSTKEFFQAERSDNLSGGPSFLNEREDFVLENVFYPNPVTDNISINPDYTDKFVSIAIYNIFGQLIMETTIGNEMNVSELPAGQYFIRLTDPEDQQYYTRIIKR
jgi:hypothetical protein